MPYFGGVGFIEISITDANGGLTALPRRIATWGRQISDLSPAFEQIGADLRDDFMRNITGAGSFFGPWAPLAATTVRRRLAEGTGAEPLWRTGTLLRSLADVGHPDHIHIVTPTSLTEGTRLYYAGFHQSGTRRMPARKIVGITWTRQQQIVRRIEEYVNGVIGHP